MTTVQFFGYLSGAFGLIAFVPYFRDIFRGRTKPERASWLIWGLLDLVALFSQLAKGGAYSLFLPAAYAVGDLGIFFLAFKYGYGAGLLKRDKFALAGVGLSLFLWYVSKEAAVALFIVILIDWIGGVLNMAKSYEDPHGETMSKWALTAISAFLACFAVGSFDLVLLAFPVSIFVMSSTMVTVIMIGRRKKPLGS